MTLPGTPGALAITSASSPGAGMNYESRKCLVRGLDGGRSALSYLVDAEGLCGVVGTVDVLAQVSH